MIPSLFENKGYEVYGLLDPRPEINWDLRIMDPEEHFPNHHIEENFGQSATYFLNT